MGPFQDFDAFNVGWVKEGKVIPAPNSGWVPKGNSIEQYQCLIGGGPANTDGGQSAKISGLIDGNARCRCNCIKGELISFQFNLFSSDDVDTRCCLTDRGFNSGALYKNLISGKGVPAKCQGKY